jgi:hypothetical protein
LSRITNIAGVGFAVFLAVCLSLIIGEVSGVVSRGVPDLPAWLADAYGAVAACSQCGHFPVRGRQPLLAAYTIPQRSGVRLPGLRAGDRSQFASYRGLGAHITELICSGGRMVPTLAAA